MTKGAYSGVGGAQNDGGSCDRLTRNDVIVVLQAKVTGVRQHQTKEVFVLARKHDEQDQDQDEDEDEYEKVQGE